MIFDFESPIFALFAELAKLGKASQDAYNLGGWLILLTLLKNGVAEGVASNPHDTSMDHQGRFFFWDIIDGPQCTVSRC